MIHYVEGDLLQSDCNVIAHGCNCFGSMGAGIAKQIAKKYPQVYEADLDYLARVIKENRDNHMMLGTISSTKINEDLHIYNLYTQYAYGTNTIKIDYSAVEFSLLSLSIDLFRVELLRQNKNGNCKPLKVGMPKIGCGLAGGDWNKVSSIIEEQMRERDVYVYVLNTNEMNTSIEAGKRINAFIKETKESK